MRLTRGRCTRLALIGLVAVALLAAVACEPRKYYAVGTSTDEFIDSSRQTPATCQHGTLGYRDLVVDYLYPSDPGVYPLIVFAHGWDVDPSYYGSFLNNLASAGFVVAAPHFPVSKSNPCSRTLDLGGQAGDISAVITHVTSGASPASGRWDSRYPVGVAGHSDGGLTVALMSHCGWDDGRVYAYAEMSGAFPAGCAYRANRAPVMAVNGSFDFNSPSYADDYYNRSVNFRTEYIANGDHTSYLRGNDPNTFQTWDAIAAFFDRFLRGDPDAYYRFTVAAGQAYRTRSEGW